MSHLQTLVAETARVFQLKHGTEPTWVVAAPGRVNLIGEHIDYNDGFVMPMAIDRYVVIAGGPAEAAAAGLYSVNLDDQAAVPLDAESLPATMHWSNYVRGVIAGFSKAGHVVPAFNAVVNSNVPTGGGLSSSAALEVATATLLESITGVTLDPIEKALLCQKAEHDFAGVPCGIMDQFSSVLCQQDHVLLLDCRSQSFEQVPFMNEDLAVLITNSGVKHELSNGEYATRRKQCEDAVEAIAADSLRDITMEQLLTAESAMPAIIFQRARHVVGEIARTVAAAEAMKSGQWQTLGQLMYQSHESLSKDFEVSCVELDVLVELARATPGVLGSRMTGGGFGGCTVTLVNADQLDEAMQAIALQYHDKTGIEPTMFATRPAQGAHAVAHAARASV